VETGECDELGVVYETVRGYHALWAAQLEEGSVATFQSEAGGQGRSYIGKEWAALLAALYQPTQESERRETTPTFALRQTAQGCYLLCKIFEADETAAKNQAHGWWEGWQALLPPPLVLKPATTQAGVELAVGFGASWPQPQAQGEKSWLNGLKIVEVIRREEIVPVSGFGANRPGEGQSLAPLVYPFRPSRAGWQAVGRALRCLPGIALTVTLHPTWLYQVEAQALLAQTERACNRLNEISTSFNRKLAKEIGERFFHSMFVRLQHPWLARVYLSVENNQSDLPGWFIQAVGATLDGPFEAGGLTNPYLERCYPYPRGLSAYMVARCWEQGAAVQDQAERNLLLYENELWAESQTALHFERLRYLCSQEEAACLFRPAWLVD
jgi:hypothetical protein